MIMVIVEWPQLNTAVSNSNGQPVLIGYMSVEPAFTARPRPSNFEEQNAAVNACVDISSPQELGDAPLSSILLRLACLPAS